MFDKNTFRLFISCLNFLSIMHQAQPQYQQEQATLQAKCEAIMNFGESCIDDYCHKKCGGLCTITPSTNQAVCVCFPGQGKGDVSRCYGTTSTGSSDDTLSAQTAICQSNCNEVVSQINPKIYAFAGICQDISHGETPSRYCVCVARHIGFHLQGIFPGSSFGKTSLAASSPEGSIIANPNIDGEESKRIGKILPHEFPASSTSSSQLILPFDGNKEESAKNVSSLISSSSMSFPITSSLAFLDFLPSPGNISAVPIPPATRTRRLSKVSSRSVRRYRSNHSILFILYFFQILHFSMVIKP